MTSRQDRLTSRLEIGGWDARVRRDPVATRVALISGAVFIAAGLVKFAFHSWELHAFRAFGLPWPSGLEILAGVIETGGGALLLARLLIVPTALLLAVTMIVAIGASGIGHGDVIPSLTLAPALLAATAFLIVRALRPRENAPGKQPTPRASRLVRAERADAPTRTERDRPPTTKKDAAQRPRPLSVTEMSCDSTAHRDSNALAINNARVRRIGVPGKDAGGVACFAREPPRTPPGTSRRGL